ncbi:lipase family protein [Chryseolinea lacunae]|uniref:Lipase family protein n=1 Tax=Chryseolinea lacunae TaxID=2801331 RepID=A0ABS1KU18_9BACT|nr:lipase family protein [Chryseolinea lacunae]MBL0742820.1 lipase family protein [Chryseolinea lacunae]
MKRKFLPAIVALVVLTISYAQAQKLKPGFQKAEYIEVLRATARHYDTAEAILKLPLPAKFKKTYRSPVVGLDNRWDLWTDGEGIGVISIRGTTVKPAGWLENFYAAMVPAKGKIRLASDFEFTYALSQQPQAAVHVGWLIATGFLSRDIVPKIDSCYKTGMKDFIIVGHSQGGAISYLLTSHLRSLQQQKLLPADIQFKTYCSAGPKPGNLYYAYEYEATTSGWAFNVVNSADWVPETPITIQTVNDFNKTNAFANARPAIKKLKFPKDVVLRHVYNQLEKPPRKAQRKYEKYLGRFLSKLVKKQLPGFVVPEFYHSTHYVRTGAFVVLLADEEYYKKFPDSKEKIFNHHLFDPYFYLAEKLPD